MTLGVETSVSEQQLTTATKELQSLASSVQVLQVEYARCLLKLRQQVFTGSSGLKVLLMLVEQQGIKRQDARQYLLIADLFLKRSQIEPHRLQSLGLLRAKLIRKAAAELLKEQGPQAVTRLVEHALTYAATELGSPYVLAGILDDVRRGLPAPTKVVATPINQPEAVKEPAEENERREVIGGILSQVLRGPKTRMPPAPTEFKVSEPVWRQLCLAVQSHRNLLLIGPAGCGKTELVQRVAAATARPLELFSFGAMSDPRTSMIGTTHFQPDKGTFFRESRFVHAISKPNCIVLLDELNRCDASAYNLLIPLLDGQRYLSLDEHPDSPLRYVADGVSFVATANVGAEYSGTKSIDKAIKDRFSTVIAMTFPSSTEEAALLLQRYRGLKPEHAQTLAKLAEQQRQLASEGEFEWMISTRMLLATSEQLSLGVPLKEAIEFTLSSHFANDGGSLSDQSRFQQLVQRFLR